ncbi:MAG: hypothetical protein KatS3mg119_0973 [Rhodothalassiaceae bacterium]|nr:MAG: hypothetical protein KatS3mg119_0973 [Rhodothalassiaceae bacterium]
MGEVANGGAAACGRDLARSRRGLLIGWGIPIGMLVLPSLVSMPLGPAVALLAGGYAWMGIACLMNARRCGRRHCYITGPLFLLAAVHILLVGARVIDWGPDGLIRAVWVPALLVPLTFIPEWVKGPYRTAGRGDG